MTAITIELNKEQIDELNNRLAKKGDWTGTDEEWKDYIIRLLMDDLGNF